jgi:ectoine hydroxylase-related dioxygenase (phytanoyl-CoA dioxygenase family)
VLQDIARDSGPLQRLLYTGRIMELYGRLFEEPARHFDFTWLRVYPPGLGTRPHMDSVFMNRGSLRLMTAWVPLGDVDRSLGGLAVLEGSQQLGPIRDDYGTRDVDIYCSNQEDAATSCVKEGPLWDGNLADNPVALRQELGLRFLTTDFRAGDLVTFPIYTVHIGLDNNTDRIRLSSDSRYYPATEPADPRWMGPEPSAHGPKSKVAKIC